MLEKTLQLTFFVGPDKTATISIKDPKQALTEQEVQNAVSVIIQNQAFAKEDVVYGPIKSAKLIERFVTTYNV